MKKAKRASKAGAILPSPEESGSQPPAAAARVTSAPKPVNNAHPPDERNGKLMQKYGIREED